jgi:hypothetical protein
LGDFHYFSGGSGKKMMILFLLVPALLAGWQIRAGAFSGEGKASFYADAFHGAVTASGERFDMRDYTAAHRELPFDAYLLVTHLGNGRKVLVRVNDRGPYVKGRMLDLSAAAARRLGGRHEGVFRVRAEELQFDPLPPSADSLYRNEPVMDCLGNKAALSGRSLVLFSSPRLMHALYVANAFYLSEDFEHVLICGAGGGTRRKYSVVLSGLPDRLAYDTLRARLERDGFYAVRPLGRD